MSFDISKFAQGFGVSESDTPGPDRIEYIDLDLIDGDPGNGYSLTDIEQLADNIQTVGLLQPLRLRPGTQGRYFVSSGHRRRLALRRLVQDGGHLLLRHRGRPARGGHRLQLLLAAAGEPGLSGWKRRLGGGL